MILEERSSHVGRSTKLADLVTSLIFFNLNDAMILRIGIQGLEQEFVKQNFVCLLLFVKVFDRPLPSLEPLRQYEAVGQNPNTDSVALIVYRH